MFMDEIGGVSFQEFSALKFKLYSLIAIGNLIFITLTLNDEYFKNYSQC